MQQLSSPHPTPSPHERQRYPLTKDPVLGDSQPNHKSHHTTEYSTVRAMQEFRVLFLLGSLYNSMRR